MEDLSEEGEVLNEVSSGVSAVRGTGLIILTCDAFQSCSALEEGIA